jgi:hypothetical protein
MSTIDLEVVQNMPPMPLLVVGGDTLARIDTLAASAKTLTIATAADADRCASIMRQAADLASAIELTRVALKAPVLELGRKIDAAAAGPLEKLRAVRAAVDGQLRQWAAAEQRRLAEETRRRQEEADRIAAERVRVEKERVRLAEEEAARQRLAAESPEAPEAPEEPELFEDFSDIAVSSNANQAAELAHQEAALQAPAPVFVRPAGVTFRTTLKFEVTNLDALPKIYVTRTVNEVAIRSTCCTGWKEGMALPIVPGLRFYAQKDPITARR